MPPFCPSDILPLRLNRGAGKESFAEFMLLFEIEATNRQIDTLVYELYGLTEEEIRIVEERAE